ncbi:PREDICTED: uncharacterized protein LOC109238667 [Nicotiana attenuata]|uniref:uncharacterized protein LOC109238667 n=1 Tax=Nicotiana attenuata TaxID=49451 RepID=UPI0009059077|nr:PREDICTED: uncharacterized protein LOC109238667 [Nicotiana attenuata]
MKQQPTISITKEKEKEEEKGQISYMQEQQPRTKEEWKTVTFHKGKKKLTMNESKESPSRAGINVNIFDATTGTSRRATTGTQVQYIFVGDRNRINRGDKRY